MYILTLGEHDDNAHGNEYVAMPKVVAQNNYTYILFCGSVFTHFCLSSTYLGVGTTRTYL